MRNKGENKAGGIGQWDLGSLPPPTCPHPGVEQTDSYEAGKSKVGSRGYVLVRSDLAAPELVQALPQG